MRTLKGGAVLRRWGHWSVVLSGKQINSTNANKLQSRFPGLRVWGQITAVCSCSVDRLGKAAGAKKARHSVLSSYFPPVGWASHLTCLFLLAGPEKKTNYSPLYQMSKGPWPQLCPNEVRKRVSLGPDMQVQILSVTG